MGISRLTAMSIINNKDVIEVLTYGPYQSDSPEPPNVLGKFGGMICWKEHPHHPGIPLLSSAYTYDTAEQAKVALQGVIDDLVSRQDEIFGRAHEALKDGNTPSN